MTDDKDDQQPSDRNELVLDEKTTKRLDEAFGNKLRLSVAEFAKVSGFSPYALRALIYSGTLRAICTGKHQYVTRPMVIEFLTRGGGVDEKYEPDNRVPPPLPSSQKWVFDQLSINKRPRKRK